MTIHTQVILRVRKSLFNPRHFTTYVPGTPARIATAERLSTGGIMRMPIRASELVQNWWAYPTSRQVLSLGRNTVRVDGLSLRLQWRITTFVHQNLGQNFPTLLGVTGRCVRCWNFANARPTTTLNVWLKRQADDYIRASELRGKLPTGTQVPDWNIKSNVRPLQVLGDAIAKRRAIIQSCLTKRPATMPHIAR